MIAKKVACPSCNVKLGLADTLPAGKMINCPKCGGAFPVPGDNGSSRSAKATVRPRKAAPPPEEDIEEEVEERPKVRKRRKKPKKAASSNRSLGLIIGAAVLLVGVGIALFVILRSSPTKTTPVADSNPSQRTPAGTAAAAEPRPTEPEPTGGASPQFAAGKGVFDANGCARCHRMGGDGSSGGGSGMGRGRGPDLATVGRDPSHTVNWLMEHIRDPKSHNPDSRMPPFGGKINDNDLRALAEYLASLK